MANRTIGSSALEEKINNLVKEVSKNFDGNKKLEDELGLKIKSIINEEEIKTSAEEISDLGSIISENMIGSDTGRVGIEVKKIKMGIDNLIEENINEVNDFRKKEFENKFIEETKKLNPDLDEEQLKTVEDYSKLISENFFDESGIEGQKEAALQNNKQIFSPGRLENAWTDVRTTVNFLKKTPDQVKDVIQKYDSLKNRLNKVNLPTNLKEARSFENIVSNFKNPDTSSLFGKTKNRLKWVDRADKLLGGRIRKTAVDVGQKFVSKIGNQSIQQFASNSLNVIAKEGFQKGFTTVLNGIINGGVNVATTAAEGVGTAGTAGMAGTAGVAGAAGAAGVAGTAGAAGTAAAGTAGAAGAGAAAAGAAGGTAAVAGGAALSATGWGAIVVAAVAAKKVVTSVGDRIAEGLGLSSKKFWQKQFGKTGGKIVDDITKPLILIFGILFAIMTFTSTSVASLVPPEGADEYEEVYDLPSDEDNTPVEPLPDSDGTADGAAIVNTAKSAIGHICYWFGGGHNNVSDYKREPMKGFDPYWGEERYIGTDGNSHRFGNNFSKTTRYVYSTDCSSFVEWVYYQNGINLGSGNASGLYFKADSNMRFANSSNLKAGDLGVAWTDKDGDGQLDPCKYINDRLVCEIYHIGIYAGYKNSRGPVWIHDGSTGQLSSTTGRAQDSLCYSPTLGYIQSGYVKEGNNSDFTDFARILK